MKKIFIIFVALVGITFMGCTQNNRKDGNEAPQAYDDEQNKVFCAQDVKECPDGTFVSRNTENNCEFDPCPEKETCDAVKECSEGKACYKFEDEDEATCFIGDPCSHCPTGNCNLAESYPPQVFCK